MLTAADTLLISVECMEQGNWSMVMGQNFTPFDHSKLQGAVQEAPRSVSFSRASSLLLSLSFHTHL